MSPFAALRVTGIAVQVIPSEAKSCYRQMPAEADMPSAWQLRRKSMLGATRALSLHYDL